MLAKPTARYEGIKLVCEFDPPVHLLDAMIAIHNASRWQLMHELRKHPAKCYGLD